MSLQAAAGSSVAPASAGLPLVNQALEPKWVRDGSSSTQTAYESALTFEEALVEQLSHALSATSGLGGESSQGEEPGSEAGGGASSGASPIASMLPQALTAGVMNAGGLGLAAQMTRELEGVAAGAATTHATGAGAPAQATGTPASSAATGGALASSGGSGS
jgi:Rod binding domain-containing protein